MKRIVSKLLLFIILLACCTSVVYATQPAQEIKVGYVSNYGTIKAAFSADSEGYGYEYLTNLINYTKGAYTLTFVACTSWQDGLDKLDSGEIDLLGPTTYVEDSGYLYTVNSFGSCTFMIAQLSDQSAAEVNTTSLEGATIAVPDYYIDDSYLMAFLQEEEIDATVITIPSLDLNITMGLEEMDYVWMSSLQTQSGLSIVTGLDSYPIYFITNAENQDLMDALDDALEALAEAEPYFQSQLALKYSSYNYTNNVYISEESYALVQEKEMYYVGIRDFYSPLIRQGEDGQLEGAAFTLLDLLSEQAGISFEYIMLDEFATQEDWDTTDFLIAATDATADLGFSYESSAYLDLPFILLEHRESSGGDIASQIIGVADYYCTDSLLVDDTLYGREVVKYKTVQELQQAFDAQEIDCMLITVVSLNMIRDDFETQDYIATTVEDTLQLSLAFSEKLSAKEITVFNKLIATVDQSVLEAAVLAYTMTEQDVTLVSVVQAQPLLLVNAVVIVLLVVFATSFFFLIRRRRDMLRVMNVDSVTGIMTEHKFIEQAREILKEDKVGKYRLLTVDIDSFKHINEIYGYEVGTALLKIVGECMNRRTEQHVIVARGTADRFMAMAPMVDQARATEWVQADMQTVHEELQTLIGKAHKLYFSIGMYQITDRTNDITVMLDYANLARRQGKQRAGTSIRVFTPAMQQEVARNNHFTSIMQQALNDEEFVLYYQPKVSLQTGAMEGAEVLVRWLRADQLMPPYQFIPLFEKNGFIEALDYYVLAKTCVFLQQNAARVTGRISVNLSGVTMLQENVVQNVIDVVAQKQIAPALIDLEITETAFVETSSVLEKVQELRKHGFTISMDDFGAGVSSLNRLKNIYVDTLKIDREFIIDALENPRGNKILQRVMDMAKDLEIQTVAEGIEMIEQGTHLQALGCQIGQGYYYARAMPEAQFVDYCTLQQVCAEKEFE